MTYPPIIQGGMGAGISSWTLARSVASRGQIGVVSGVALDLIMTRRLQLGDPGGHVRRALDAFPGRDISRRIIERYFVADGKVDDKPFASKPMVGQKLSRRCEELLIAGNFVEVFLAKEGHGGTVGINYLHKIQTTLLPSIFGAMLAGVDVVIVGAGIPFDIPGILEGLSRGEPVDLTLHVRGELSGQPHKMQFDPGDYLSDALPAPPRPRFFPIVSSAALAALMVKKCNGQIDGMIIEAPTAGGHNAPPRGRVQLSDDGEPVYGPRDEVDLDAIRSLGIPFWLAGSCGSPEKVRQARDAGATGVQVGTLFAFCEESGLRDDLKRDVLGRCRTETPLVFTDPVASPAGFPFKVLSVPGTLSDLDLYALRHRRCDLGYLREAYENGDGTLGWRCPADAADAYVNSGGAFEDTVGRKCLCNALLANIGMAQVRKDKKVELPLITCGDDLSGLLQVLPDGEASYSSARVIDFLLAE